MHIYISIKKNIYAHDNFVDNMSSEGYDKMKKTLEKYIETVKEEKSR